MTSKAAQAGFAILKDDWFEGPMDSMDRPDSPVRAPSMPVRGMPIRPEMADKAKQLFLGTIMAFLEQDQEDYVGRNLPEASPEEIEAGRSMALEAIKVLDMM